MPPSGGHDYPLIFSVDYPDRSLDRLTTALRIFTVIPITILAATIEGGGFGSQAGGEGVRYAGGGIGVLFIPVVLMLLFRKKYPRVVVRLEPAADPLRCADRCRGRVVMVPAMASAFSTQDSSATITFAARPASIAIAYGIGVLLTLVVVVVSARKVSRMNIVTAIRDLPEPPVKHSRKRRWALGVAGLAVGVMLAVAGASAKDAVGLGFGVLVIVISLMPILRAVGVPQRLAYTLAGAALILWFTLPVSRWLFGEMKVNFSIFILGGLAIVIGSELADRFQRRSTFRWAGVDTRTVRRLAPV